MHTLRAFLDLLACPLCVGQLQLAAGTVDCIACGRRFPQPSTGPLDLLPPEALQAGDQRWIDRQKRMEAWYERLAGDTVRAAEMFRRDYAPYAAFLRACSGRVLDVGGGNGVVRDFLPPDAEYVVLDPSLDWLDEEWSLLAGEFPSLKAPPSFVRGVGEFLPFPSDSYDVVLALWSLNHAVEPARVLADVHRVLRPGGRFLLVLEDMEPGWLDTAALLSADGGGRLWGLGRLALKVARLAGLPWPVQADHVRIGEDQLRGWLRGRFETLQRSWRGGYLTYHLRAQ